MLAATRSGEEEQLRGARVLAIEGRALEKSYRGALRSAFDASIAAAAQRRAKAAGASGLSLVAMDDTELGNQVQMAAKRARGLLQESYGAVALRLQNLPGAREAVDADSLLGPEMFVTAAAQALSTVISSPRDVAGLVRHIPSAMAPALTSTYDAIVLLLDRKGLGPASVARNLGPPTVRMSAPATLGGNAAATVARVDANGEPTRTGARSVPLRFSLPTGAQATAAGGRVEDADLVEYGRLQALLGVNANSLIDAAVSAARALAVGRQIPIDPPPAKLVEAMVKVQRHDAARLGTGDRAREGAGASDSAAEGTREIGRMFIGLAAHSVHRLAIQLVARIFTRMERDRLVPGPVRDLLLCLRLPFMEVALADPSIFVRRDHPARALIDAIGTSAIGRLTDASAGERRYLQQVRGAVQFVVHSPGGAASAFAQAHDHFQTLMATPVHGEPDRYAAARAALTQAEERELRASAVAVFLREILEGAQLEGGLRDFLLHIWPRVLVEANVRKDSAPELARSLLNLVPNLVWSVQPPTAATDRKRLIDVIPAVVAGIWDGARLIGWPEAKVQALLDELMRAHAAVLKAPEGQGGGTFSVSTVRIRLDGVRIEEIAAGVPDRNCFVVEEAVRQTLAAGQSGIEHQFVQGPVVPGAPMAGEQAHGAVANWSERTWFELQVDAKPVRVRLEFFSPARTLALFCAAGGRPCYSISRDGMAAMLRAGTLRAVESLPVTARALRRVLKDLERSVQAASDGANGAA